MAGHLFGTKANLGRPFLGAVPGSGRRPTETGAADLKEQCLLLERRACAGNEGISNSLFGGEKKQSSCLHSDTMEATNEVASCQSGRSCSSKGFSVLRTSEHSLSPSAVFAA